MGISIRRSIAWLPAPHSEPTSTVVLTSPARRFVDVRVTLADQSLEWGFAGTSSYAAIDDVHEKGQWRHWVDNQHELGAEVVDEGVCSKQADGSMLEVGAMVNPATGAVGDYEEVWDDVKPVGPAGDAARCIVLQHETATSRGVVELLGVYLQGVLKNASGTSVERWQWTDADGGAWKQTFTAGGHDTGLPCETAFRQAATLQEGDTLTFQGLSWTVVEAAAV